MVLGAGLGGARVAEVPWRWVFGGSFGALEA